MKIQLSLYCSLVTAGDRREHHKDFKLSVKKRNDSQRSILCTEKYPFKNNKAFFPDIPNSQTLYNWKNQYEILIEVYTSKHACTYLYMFCKESYGIQKSNADYRNWKKYVENFIKNIKNSMFTVLNQSLGHACIWWVIKALQEI